MVYMTSAAAKFDYKVWYEKNGAELNSSRKSRYQNDPEYRAKVVAQNRKSRAKVRVNTQATGVVSASPAWKEMEIQVTGEDGNTSVKKVVTVGALATAIGKSVQSIRLWEQKGWIPTAPYRSKKGDRLYTLDTVMELYEKLKADGRVSDVIIKARPRSYKYTVSFADGDREVVLFPIGELAEVCGRNISTIEQLEAKGFFPKTPFRSPTTGYRLYTVEMIEAASEAFKGHDAKDDSSWLDFYQSIKIAWDATGILDKPIIAA